MWILCAKMPDFSSQAAQIARNLTEDCPHEPKPKVDCPDCCEEVLIASLTLAHQQGRVEEREECAKVVEEYAINKYQPAHVITLFIRGEKEAVKTIADAIRGRGSHDA